MYLFLKTEALVLWCLEPMYVLKTQTRTVMLLQPLHPEKIINIQYEKHIYWIKTSNKKFYNFEKDFTMADANFSKVKVGNAVT